MSIGRKEYDMKTIIRVTSCFDGSIDAMDVFVDIIAERIKCGDNIICFTQNAKMDYLKMTAHTFVENALLIL